MTFLPTVKGLRARLVETSIALAKATILEFSIVPNNEGKGKVEAWKIRMC